MPSTIDTTAIRNITPIVTPRSVKKLFSFCTRICASASRMASRNGIYFLVRGCVDLARFHPRGENLFPFIAGDHSVAKNHNAPCVRGDVSFVRDHDHSLTLTRQLLEHFPDFQSARLPEESTARSRERARLQHADAVRLRARSAGE